MPRRDHCGMAGPSTGEGCFLCVDRATGCTPRSHILGARVLRRRTAARVPVESAEPVWRSMDAGVLAEVIMGEGYRCWSGLGTSRTPSPAGVGSRSLFPPILPLLFADESAVHSRVRGRCRCTDITHHDA